MGVADEFVQLAELGVEEFLVDLFLGLLVGLVVCLWLFVFLVVVFVVLVDVIGIVLSRFGLLFLGLRFGLFSSFVSRLCFA